MLEDEAGVQRVDHAELEDGDAADEAHFDEGVGEVGVGGAGGDEAERNDFVLLRVVDDAVDAQAGGFGGDGGEAGFGVRLRGPRCAAGRRTVWSSRGSMSRT